VKSSTHTRLLSAFLFFCLVLAACNMPARPASPMTTVAVASPSAAPTDSGFPVSGTPPVSTAGSPTAGVATTAANKAVLLALPGADPGQVAALEGLLAELASESGLVFETQHELAGQTLGADVRLAVVPSPDPGVMNLANANPGVQFLAVGMEGMQAAGNVSVISGNGARPDQQGFVAGYLSALITPDWRVGVISRSDTPEGKAARNGFNNGTVFYCGLCRPAYPPFVQYPVFADVTADTSAEGRQAAADSLVANAVKTVYLAPGAGDAALAEYLAGKGLQVIGGTQPPPAAATQWVASLRADPVQAVRTAWTRLLDGEQGFSLETPLAVTDRNESLFSAGRQRLVDNLLADLLAGFIETGVNLETGELK